MITITAAGNPSYFIEGTSTLLSQYQPYSTGNSFEGEVTSYNFDDVAYNAAQAAPLASTPAIPLPVASVGGGAATAATTATTAAATAEDERRRGMGGAGMLSAAPIAPVAPLSAAAPATLPAIREENWLQVPAGTPGAVYRPGAALEGGLTEGAGWFLDPTLLGATYTGPQEIGDTYTPGMLNIPGQTPDTPYELGSGMSGVSGGANPALANYWAAGKSPEYLARSRGPLEGVYGGVVADPFYNPGTAGYNFGAVSDQAKYIAPVRNPIPEGLVAYLDQTRPGWDAGLAQALYRGPGGGAQGLLEEAPGTGHYGMADMANRIGLGDITSPFGKEHSGIGATGKNWQIGSNVLADYLRKTAGDDPNVAEYVDFISSPDYLKSLSDEATAQQKAEKAGNWASGIMIGSMFAAPLMGAAGAAGTFAGEGAAAAGDAAATAAAGGYGGAVGGGLTGMLQPYLGEYAGMGSGALTGAAKGALTSVATGGNPLEGALRGGASGGIGAATPWLSEQFGGGTLSNIGAGALTGAGAAYAGGGDEWLKAALQGAAGGAAKGLGAPGAAGEYALPAGWNEGAAYGGTSMPPPGFGIDPATGELVQYAGEWQPAQTAEATAPEYQLPEYNAPAEAPYTEEAVPVKQKDQQGLQEFAQRLQSTFGKATEMTGLASAAQVLSERYSSVGDRNNAIYDYISQAFGNLPATLTKAEAEALGISFDNAQYDEGGKLVLYMNPGSKGYFDYLMAQTDKVIERVLGGDETDEGKLIESLRGKRDEEIADLYRALNVRGILGSVQSGSEAINPFTGQKEQFNVMPGEQAANPLAGYLAGLASEGRQLAGLRGGAAENFVQSLMNRRTDLFGMQEQADKQLQDAIQAQALEEEMRRRRGMLEGL